MTTTVRGTFSSHRCDERCMGAKGPDCTCACGGANHGKWTFRAQETALLAAAEAAKPFALQPLAEGEPVTYAPPIGVTPAARRPTFPAALPLRVVEGLGQMTLFSTPGDQLSLADYSSNEE